MGAVHLNQENIPAALECFAIALKIPENLYNMVGDNGAAECLNNIAMVYEMQGDHALALQCFERSLALEEKAGNSDVIASSLAELFQ